MELAGPTAELRLVVTRLDVAVSHQDLQTDRSLLGLNAYSCDLMTQIEVKDLLNESVVSLHKVAPLLWRVIQLGQIAYYLKCEELARLAAPSRDYLAPFSRQILVLL